MGGRRVGTPRKQRGGDFNITNYRTNTDALDELKEYLTSEGIGDEVYEIAKITTMDVFTNLEEKLGFENANNAEKEMIKATGHVLAEYIFELPKVNNIKKAETTYGLMLNASNKLPRNMAAHIASYATGVAPRNNPAYMKNF